MPPISFVGDFIVNKCCDIEIGPLDDADSGVTTTVGVAEGENVAVGVAEGDNVAVTVAVAVGVGDTSVTCGAMIVF